MTLCTPNPLTQPVPTCTQYLEIGTISTPSANVHVYIKDITTGRVDFMECTSDGDGLITIDLTEFGAMASHTYEFWVTLQAATSSEDKETITIETETSERYALRFRDIYEGEDSHGYTTQTLTLA